MNTTENNKLIAEFMGLTFLPHLEQWHDKEGYNVGELQYHTSWDWLMPVIKKIDCIANEEMTFAEYDDYRNIKWRMINSPSKYEIEDVFNQVVEFIKWYNENKED